MRLQFALSVLIAAVLAASAGGSAVDRSGAFLSDAFNVTSAEISRIDEGQVVTRTLDVKNRREVATLGIVRIATTPHAYVERLVDIARFKRTDGVLQIGTLSSPPQLRDVAGLSVEEGDLSRLRDCSVGDCDVRLSAEDIGRFRRDIDWRAPDASGKASSLLRQLLVDYVTRYRTSGAAAAMEYASTASSLNVGREFESLVAAETTVWKYAPRLRRYLLEYPAAGDAKASDLFYWSKEMVHSRPVISITQVVIVETTDDSPVQFAIGSKQIYAMHYFDASLGLTLLVRDPAAPRATYVVYLNRSRIDLFEGTFGRITRRIVAGKAKSLVAEQLGRLQRTLADGSALEAHRLEQ